MRRTDEDYRNPLADVALGDIIELPDGRSVTARSRVDLDPAVGPMAGFIICGELDLLLSVPASANAPVDVYVPVDYLPASAENARTVHQGAFSYWAPHLPSVTGAMAELLYRVIEVPGSIYPIVIVYRGEEVVIFIRATFAHSNDLRVIRMPRTENNDFEVTRHTGSVEAPLPAVEPAPQRLPANPVRKRSRRRTSV